MAPAPAANRALRRAVIEKVFPEVDEGAFPIKRITGDSIRVDAHVFADGHDVVACVLRHRHESEEAWTEVPMTPPGNDEWTAEFTVERTGRHLYTVCAWTDPFRTWHRDFIKRVDAGQDVSIDILVGAALAEKAAKRASGSDRKRLSTWAAELRADTDIAARTEKALHPGQAALAKAYPDRKHAAEYRLLEAWVDREIGRFSAWYEMFPRSASPDPSRAGTLQDVIARLPYVAELGFDILYLPPIHPIGTTFRKGRNNSLECGPDDPGSPWAIGSEHGGHKDIHPALGTLEDFRELVHHASQLGIELALDIAFQCSPDHPYVREHPDWFRSRPDGTIQYAENPPKKYQDIYPFDFECRDWRGLWEELKSVFLFWAAQGVRVFRVDNPHTKPFAFWQWVLAEVRRDCPDAVFLSEAFTRPKIMYRLAKLGFTQSYNYFPWRTGKHELIEYFTELTQTEVREFFRPSLWTNTPDILISYLQEGGRQAFIIRYVLASTLGASYGIYGPAFELCEGRSRGPLQEEYLDSEKYEARRWDLDDPAGIRDIISRVNTARREHPALQTDANLLFHAVDNDQLLCYSKQTGSDLVLVFVNLDFRNKQAGWVELPLDWLGIDEQLPFKLHDILTGESYAWTGARNFVELRHESGLPAHVFLVSQGEAEG